MKRRFVFLLALISIFSLLLGQTPSLAQPSQPPDRSRPPIPNENQKSKDGAPGYRHEIKSDGSMPENHHPPQRPQQISPQGIGGPDDFGYTWDDSVPWGWISSPTYKIGPSGDDETLLVDIGFAFEFYENTYNQVYISTNGILVFGRDEAGCCGEFPIPSPGQPNNVITPYWDDLTVGEDYNTGSIIYFNITTATEKIFVVEWDNVTDCCGGGATDYKTFQVLLYDNGNIKMQYANMTGFLDWASTGIEDSFGGDGLQYPDLVAKNKAILFTRPGPTARVQIFPQYYGTFSQVRSQAILEVPIRNTGELGADIYDLLPTSSWQVSLFASDGNTPLTDTDSDGIVDTGPVPQSGSVTVVAKVKTPAAAQVGDDNSATLTATSSLNLAKSKTAMLRTAVPTNFAQVFRDDADGAMSFLLVTPEKQTLKKTSGDDYYGYDLAVSETSGFAYLWDKYYYYPDNYINTSDVEFTLFDENGMVSRSVSKLTDNGAANMDTFDWEPVVAASPDKHIGVSWRRLLYNDSNQVNANVYFAVLNESGDLISGPVNLTNNAAWGYSSDDNVPRFYDVKISATGDGRFVIAWNRENHESSGYVTDIYYTVRGSNGSEIRPITRFTFDTPGWDEAYYNPNLAALQGNRVLLTWCRSSNGDLYYAVLNSSGDVLLDSKLTLDTTQWWDYESDAVQLSDGNILIAWTSWSSTSDTPQIRFAVLDTAYHRTSAPTALLNPAAVTGDYSVSVTSDLQGNAVLTWMEYSYYNRRNLYYALVNGKGEVVTEPMIFRNAALSSGGEYYIESSYLGYGNASYRVYDLVYDTFLPLTER